MIYTICNIEKEKNKRINKSPPLPHHQNHHIHIPDKKARRHQSKIRI